ncbi:MAG: V-type ATP synthase subunit A [Thermovirgaceae bacterium]
MENQGRVIAVNGPVVRASGMKHFGMREMVHTGDEGLVGEIIRMEGDEAVIQVYEETEGLRPGEPVTGTGEPLSISLGPGLLGSIFDGIGRPLGTLLGREGPFLGRGLQVDQIDLSKTWEIAPKVSEGDTLSPGMLLAVVQETPLFQHRILVPPECSGELTFLAPPGLVAGGTEIARLRDEHGREESLTMIHRWPVRTPRPSRRRLPLHSPLLTGQRVIDGLFPIAKGGVAAIPGGFGTGKTVTQHQLARWSDAEVVVYIGCGERGNEMTEVLEEFPKLEDPRSGRPLMERTVLIANTSNMPVAAREASIYTGITIAEYFRDMGCDVALMADSTSRWAEAIREVSGRLEEIPAEEGFPAYLPTRLAEFYERAGRVETLGGGQGSISVVGAVSPPGGDFTEPVTRHTKRFIRCFWALDKRLANARHFPAINWLESYSEYGADLEDWFASEVDPRWRDRRDQASELLTEDDRIQQIIRLVGEDVLPDDQRLVALCARLVKDGYLQQSAFGPESYQSPRRSFAILDLILHFWEKADGMVKEGVPLSLIRKPPEVMEITRIRELRAEDESAIAELRERLDKALDTVASERSAAGKGRTGA